MDAVRSQYEKWPYPNVPLLARVPASRLWQINAAWIAARAHQPVVENPSIWIAGCGTFQPYVFAQANPSSPILATDISQTSLDIARRRCRNHGLRNLTFETLDLSDPSAFPSEQFDLIECYGVLMCLPDPALTLRELAQRLKPGGVLRLMVYPHYGRQRIFQIQRLAKILGLHYQDDKAPSTLRKILRALPEQHPLAYAFASYADSANSQGIVDAFLHASDRGFTGIEICDLIDRAGLDLAFALHRPWGQPRAMAEKLGLLPHDPAQWLHYLDLWQNLRTNFILCAIPKIRPQTEAPARFTHPLFSLQNRSLPWRERARLLTMAALGAEVDSRTHADGCLRLKGSQVRRLLANQIDSQTQDIAHPQKEAVLGPAFLGTSRQISPNTHWALRPGPLAPNPLYAHLFDAYCYQEQWTSHFAHPFPNLEAQLRRWKPLCEPLEDSTHPFGLTPFGTLNHSPPAVSQAARDFAKLPTLEFEGWRPRDRSAHQQTVRKFLKELEVRKTDFTESELEELWVLLFSYDRLFLPYEN